MPNPQRIRATVDALAALPQPVALGDLPGIGLTRGRTRSAIAAGALVQVRRGFVVPTDLWEQADPRARHDLRLRAALRAYPGTWASRESAGRLVGLPVFDDGPDDPHVHISRSGTTAREPHVTVHGNEVPDGFVDTIAGLRTTNLVRTAVELSAVPSQRRAIAVMDAAMRLMIASRDPDDVRARVLDAAARDHARHVLDAAIGPYSRHRWVTSVRRAVASANPAAESVLESFSRVAMCDARLPEPECGVPVVGDDGRTYWADFLWRRHRVIGEADGAAKYRQVSQLVEEKRREEALRGAGWTVVRWGWPEAVTDPQVMVRRLRAALAAPPTGTPWS